MSKISGLRVVAKDGVAELPGLSGEVRLALSEVAASAREGLLAMSVATGGDGDGRDDGGRGRRAGRAARQA